MNERYVRHLSGQGKTWKVRCEWDVTWDCTPNSASETGASIAYFLPKSEYVLCEPPERWEDVTSECECRSHGDFSDGLYHQGKAVRAREYRLRKVECTVGFRPERRCCFIVEKKVQP